MSFNLKKTNKALRMQHFFTKLVLIAKKIVAFFPIGYCYAGLKINLLLSTLNIEMTTVKPNIYQN